MDVGKEALDLLAQTYRGKALDTFIRGLRGNLSLHLGMREGKAFHLCLKMENQFGRSHFAHLHNQSNKNNYNRHVPQPPNRAYQDLRLIITSTGH